MVYEPRSIEPYSVDPALVQRIPRSASTRLSAAYIPWTVMFKNRLVVLRFA
jgi:hypothetical protein